MIRPAPDRVPSPPESMRPITAIECLLSGFPMGTEVSADATQAEVVAGGPQWMERIDV